MSSPNPELSHGPTPDIEKVAAAYADIREHNSRHTGFGAMFRGVLKGLVKGEDFVSTDTRPVAPVGSDEEVDGAFQDNIVEGDMNAELQDIFHNDTFLRAGIKIAPFGQFIADKEGKAVTSTELVPMIENTALFTEYLGELESKDAQNEGTEMLLDDVITNLSKLTSLCFDKKKLENLSDEARIAHAEVGEDALRTFVVIDSEYVRLGIDGVAMRERVQGISKELSDFLSSGRGGSVPMELGDEYSQYTKNQQKMRVYEGMSARVEYWGRDLLPEYIEAQNGQYLTPPSEQGFGPAGWQKDGGQYHWQEVFDYLGRLEQEDRTKPFGGEVKRGLIISLDAALTEANESSEDVYWKGQTGDLENIRNALSGQQFDEEKLSAYIKKPDYRS